MQRFALQITTGESRRFQWRIWHKDKPEGRFEPFVHSLPVYKTYQDALDAGAVMLARVAGQPYENAAGNAMSDDIDLHVDPAPAPRFI